MKKISFIIITLVALASFGCTSTTDQKRYELVCCPFTQNNNTYVGMRVLDTYTGEVWLYTGLHRDQDSNWMYSGTPTKLKLK